VADIFVLKASGLNEQAQRLSRHFAAGAQLLPKYAPVR